MPSQWENIRSSNKTSEWRGLHRNDFISLVERFALVALRDEIQFLPTRMEGKWCCQSFVQNQEVENIGSENFDHPWSSENRFPCWCFSAWRHGAKMILQAWTRRVTTPPLRVRCRGSDVWPAGAADASGSGGCWYLVSEPPLMTLKSQVTSLTALTEFVWSRLYFYLMWYSILKCLIYKIYIKTLFRAEIIYCLFFSHQRFWGWKRWGWNQWPHHIIKHHNNRIKNSRDSLSQFLTRVWSFPKCDLSL